MFSGDATQRNFWYRKNDKGVKFTEDCVDEIIKQLKELINDSCDELKKILNSYF